MIVLGGKGCFRIAAIGNGIHGETGKPQPYGQSVEEDCVVFYHEYAHEFLFPPSLTIRSTRAFHRASLRLS
ncbi:hypothetical protein D3C80_2123060 [compost metagenome]